MAEALLEPLPLLPPHQQPGAVAMHEATRNRDLEGMARLVEAHPHLIGSPDVVGRTPLMMACLRGHAEVAAWLLDRGADANGTDSNHRTAMYNAASYGFTEVLALLLERGGDPSIGDVEGNTPLTAAAYYGYEAVVRRLLAFKEGKDPDDLDRKGERRWSGLYLACESGHARIARLFLEAGADPTLADTHGMTPLDIAREMCNWRCARLLERSLREPQRVALLRKAHALTEARQGLATLEAQEAHTFALLSAAAAAAASSASASTTGPATPVRTRGGKRKRSLLHTPPYLRARVEKGRPLPRVEVGAASASASALVSAPSVVPRPGVGARAGPAVSLFPLATSSSSAASVASTGSSISSTSNSSSGATTSSEASSCPSKGRGGRGGGKRGKARRKVQRYHPQEPDASSPASKQGHRKEQEEEEEPVAAGVARAVVGGALPPELFRELCEFMRVKWDPCFRPSAEEEEGQGQQAAV